MHKAAKLKVIEYLRSGKYKQGVCELRSLDNQYCALGLIEQARIDTIGGPGWKESRSTYLIEGSNSNTLCQVTQNWLGVKTDNPKINGTYMTALNEKLQVSTDAIVINNSFERIADLLEADIQI